MKRLANVWPEKVVVEIMYIHPEGKAPTKVRGTDVGYDIHACSDQEIPPHTCLNIHTGIRVACPAGYYMTLDGRSSLWSRGIIANRGIIDATYNGELLVSLHNITFDMFNIEQGDRIAQLIIHRQMEIDFYPVREQFSPEYDGRGERGFGSTGR